MVMRSLCDNNVYSHSYIKIKYQISNIFNCANVVVKLVGCVCVCSVFDLYETLGLLLWIVDHLLVFAFHCSGLEILSIEQNSDPFKN
jgi:hypothetical protein